MRTFFAFAVEGFYEDPNLYLSASLAIALSALSAVLKFFVLLGRLIAGSSFESGNPDPRKGTLFPAFLFQREDSSFGDFTSFEFRVHPVSTVLGGLVMYPRDRAVEVLQFYRDFTQSAPEELTAYAALVHTPDGIPAVAVIACYCGDVAEGEQVFKPLRTFSSRMMDAIQIMPFPQMQTLLDAAFPDGNQNYWKSTFLRELSDDAILVLVEHANRATSPLSGVTIEYYGGVASRVGASETAFAQRQAQYDVAILAQWVDPGESHLLHEPEHQTAGLRGVAFLP